MARKYFGWVWERASATRGSASTCGFGRLRLSGASLAYGAAHDVTAERLGHTSTRMVDAIYAKLYADASRHLADAIGELFAFGARETDH